MVVVDLWRLWRAYEEVKNMDKKGIVNLLASALTTAIGIATADYTATGTIHWAALATGVLAAIVNHVRQSPRSV